MTSGNDFVIIYLLRKLYGYENPFMNGGEYMSTFEATVDLMRNLPENDLLKINGSYATISIYPFLRIVYEV